MGELEGNLKNSVELNSLFADKIQYGRTIKRPRGSAEIPRSNFVRLLPKGRKNSHRFLNYLNKANKTNKTNYDTSSDYAY